MKATLYTQSKDIEIMDEKLRDLHSSNQIDVAELQKNLFQRYEGNSVLYDAIQGRQLIEESLEELGQVNRGIRKVLPWKGNKGHNERIKQIGELVSEPYHLHSSGIFMPDNLVTAAAGIIPLVFGMAFGISYSLIRFYPNSTPEELQQLMHTFQVINPTIMSAISAPVLGLLANIGRFAPLPDDQAKYLDGKVKDFYK